MRHGSRSDLPTLVGACSLILGLAGCFNPDYPDIGFACEKGKCPAGYSCQGPPGARLCVRDGVKPRSDSVTPWPDQASRVDLSPLEDRRQTLEPGRKDLVPKPDQRKPDGFVLKADGCLKKCWCTKNPLPDGCGGQCPICPNVCCGPYCCGGGLVCGPNNSCCKPLTCSSTPLCGPQPDSCGGTIDCATCPNGQVCQNGQCVSQCSQAGGFCKASADCCPTGLSCNTVTSACCYVKGAPCPSSTSLCCSGTCDSFGCT